MAEQEQNGVTIPSSAAKMFPKMLFLPPSALRVRSGVKKVRTIPTKKIINVSSNSTLGNSKTKNQIASVQCSPRVICNTSAIK